MTLVLINLNPIFIVTLCINNTVLYSISTYIFLFILYKCKKINCNLLFLVSLFLFVSYEENK